MAGSYNVGDLMGKTLKAKKQLIAWIGSPNSKTFFTIPGGKNAGVLYSYVYAGKNKKDLFFEFEGNMSTLDQPYFVMYSKGAFDGSELREQGVKTVEQKIKEKEEEEARDKHPVEYYIDKYGKKVLIFTGVTVITVVAIKEGVKYLSNRRNG